MKPNSCPVLAVLVAAPLMWGAPARSQVAGDVTDPGNRPVAGALIQLWSPTERLAGDTTGDEGAFAFDTETARGATLLIVRAIGYRATQVPIYGRGPHLHVVLEPIAVALPPVEVRPSGRPCEHHDDPEARRLWEAVRRRYAQTADSGALATGMRVFRGIVPESLLGVLDTAQLGRGQRGATGQARAIWRNQIDKTGYAWHLRRPSYETAVWEYVPLESDYAQHFAEPLFGRLHRLARQLAPAGQVAIAFCPTSTGRPEIEGVLYLSDDTALVAAEWAFVTPPPREVAGGRVTFTRPESGTAMKPLLPIDGLGWRRQSAGQYEVLWQVYSGWVLERGPQHTERDH